MDRKYEKNQILMPDDIRLSNKKDDLSTRYRDIVAADYNARLFRALKPNKEEKKEIDRLRKEYEITHGANDLKTMQHIAKIPYILYENLQSTYGDLVNDPLFLIEILGDDWFLVPKKQISKQYKR